MDSDAIDLSTISPEDFAKLAATTGDEEMEGLIRAVGTERALDRIFAGFEERFQPELAVGVEGVTQFVVEDRDEQHPYVVAIAGGSCSVSHRTTESPKATITLGLSPLVRLVTGQAEGVKLFMGGKLKASGDVIFAAGLTRYFDRPSA